MLRFGDWEDRERVTARSPATGPRPLTAPRSSATRTGNGAAPDRPIDWVQPWSAAFISWVMCEGGLGDMNQFARDISHRVYIDQAIRARDGQAPDAAFVAHDAGEAEIQPGDLLCNARGSASYRSLADRRRESGEYAPLHCDIVVRVDADAGLFHMIGGNVMNSVTLTILPGVRDGDHLRPLAEDDLDGARTMFAHLQLRAPAIEPNALDATPDHPGHERALNPPRTAPN